MDYDNIKNSYYGVNTYSISTRRKFSYIIILLILASFSLSIKYTLKCRIDYNENLEKYYYNCDLYIKFSNYKEYDNYREIYYFLSSKGIVLLDAKLSFPEYRNNFIVYLDNGYNYFNILLKTKNGSYIKLFREDKVIYISNTKNNIVKIRNYEIYPNYINIKVSIVNFDKKNNNFLIFLYINEKLIKKIITTVKGGYTKDISIEYKNLDCIGKLCKITLRIFRDNNKKIFENTWIEDYKYKLRIENNTIYFNTFNKFYDKVCINYDNFLKCYTESMFKLNIPDSVSSIILKFYINKRVITKTIEIKKQKILENIKTKEKIKESINPIIIYLILITIILLLIINKDFIIATVSNLKNNITIKRTLDKNPEELYKEIVKEKDLSKSYEPVEKPPSLNDLLKEIRETESPTSNITLGDVLEGKEEKEEKEMKTENQTNIKEEKEKKEEISQEELKIDLIKDIGI